MRGKGQFCAKGQFFTSESLAQLSTLHTKRHFYTVDMLKSPL